MVDCIEFCILSSLNFPPSLMHLSFASPLVNPWDTPREPRRNGTILVFLFFLRGKVSYLVLKTTSTKGTHPRNVFEFCSAVYRSRLKFFEAIYFILMPHFDIMLGVFILPPREGLFFINFVPFTQGL